MLDLDDFDDNDNGDYDDRDTQELERNVALIHGAFLTTTNEALAHLFRMLVRGLECWCISKNSGHYLAYYRDSSFHAQLKIRAVIKPVHPPYKPIPKISKYVLA